MSAWQSDSDLLNGQAKSNLGFRGHRLRYAPGPEILGQGVFAGLNFVPWPANAVWTESDAEAGERSGLAELTLMARAPGQVLADEDGVAVQFAQDGGCVQRALRLGVLAAASHPCPASSGRASRSMHNPDSKPATTTWSRKLDLVAGTVHALSTMQAWARHRTLQSIASVWVVLLVAVVPATGCDEPPIGMPARYFSFDNQTSQTLIINEFIPGARPDVQELKIVEPPPGSGKRVTHPFPRGRRQVTFQAKDAAGRFVWRRTFTAEELEASSFRIVITERDLIEYVPTER